MKMKDEFRDYEKENIIPMFPFQPYLLKMIEGKNHDYELNNIRQQLEKEFVEWSNEVQQLSNQFKQKTIDNSIDILETIILDEVKPSKRKLYELYLDKVNSLITTAPPQVPFAGLLRELSTEQTDKLFMLLTSGYIDKTDRQSIDYIFGGKDKPQRFTPVVWLLSKQLLRELLTGLQKEMKFNRINTQTRELSKEIERQTSTYFVDKKGQPFTLANNKPAAYSPKSMKISKFLATL